VVHVVECLPTKHKTLISNLSSTLTPKKSVENHVLKMNIHWGEHITEGTRTWSLKPKGPVTCTAQPLTICSSQGRCLSQLDFMHLKNGIRIDLLRKLWWELGEMVCEKHLIKTQQLNSKDSKIVSNYFCVLNDYHVPGIWQTKFQRHTNE
jgi:hypothetical protein